MKDTFYFSHDYNASSDEKIIRLLSRHGMAGYGTFWRIIESLYNNQNDMQADYERIAYELHVSDTKTIKSVIEDFDLFVIKDGFFGSRSIEKRLKERNDKSNKARESAFRRWNKQSGASGKINPDAIASESDAIASESDAIKERKEKDIKDIKEINAGKPVNVSEIISYLNEKTGKQFRATNKKTKQLIEARRNDGATYEVFIKVIDCKVADWKGDPKMDKHLCPETLFGQKFEKYRNQKLIPEKKKGKGPSSVAYDGLDHNSQTLYGNGIN